MFVTPLYAAFFGILLVVLSWRIQKLRVKTNTRMNEEGHTAMTAATRAQGHLVEYTPMALILMLIAEFQDFSPYILHTVGLLLIIGRFLHLKGVRDHSGKSASRKAGTRLTWAAIILASFLCVLGYFGLTF